MSWKVEEDSAETGKTGCVNHKQIVWHASFLKLLESAIWHLKTGYHHKCADDIIRWLFPIILILSADYEEQYVLR
jgi:acyl-CoA thioesterase FadM